MKKGVDLTTGSIFKRVIGMAIPIMATSFIQMAYNLTDMMWVGKIGSDAVAAVGAAGFFTWFASALILVPKTGAEIGVAQAVGKKNNDESQKYISTAIQMVIFFGIIYSIFLVVFRKYLIGFFALNDVKVEGMAVSYLLIISIGICFYFINPVFTAIYNGYGDSKTPFYMNSIGLIVNIILDPVLIFGLMGMPKLGIEGAALATILAQCIVTVCFVVYTKKKTNIFENFKLFLLPKIYVVKRIFRLGIPSAVYSGSFTFFAMVLAKMAAKWGPVPIAVQEIGSQIEAISWMTTGGFATAICAFIGQNYGAGKNDRIDKGYKIGLYIVIGIGVFATILFWLFGKPLMSIFFHEEEAIKLGIEYLKIIAFCQIISCMDGITVGAFNGMGKTFPGSITGIICVALRIPIAMILSQDGVLGLHGVWWTITITNVLKGSIILIWYKIFKKKSEFMKSNFKMLKKN